MDSRYYEVNSASDRVNERADCAVRAVTLATGLPYNEVREAFINRGRKPRTATARHTTIMVLDDLGYVARPMTLPMRRTVRVLIRDDLRSEGTYLIRIKGHIFCHKNGVTFDMRAKRLYKVREVYRVIPKSRNRPNVKKVLRERFVAHNNYTRAGLLKLATELGVTPATIFTAISDLKNPKYSAGPPLDIEKVVSPGGTYYVLHK